MRDITPEQLFRLLFIPFENCRGEQALRYGLFAILVAGAIASFGKAHFDGVLDVHFGPSYSMVVFMIEGVIDWLCASLVFMALVRFIFKSKVPAIEIFGTQALARAPSVLSSLAVFPPYLRTFSYELLKQLQTPGNEVTLSSVDGTLLAISLLVVLAALVWMVTLMWQSYTILIGPQILQDKSTLFLRIFTFVLGLVIAEILSKALILMFIFSISAKLPQAS